MSDPAMLLKGQFIEILTMLDLLELCLLACLYYSLD